MHIGDVDLCLVPEVAIELEGENGCLPFLKQRVAEQGHAVVVVAEGSLSSLSRLKALPGQNAMSDRYEPIQGGNKMVISTVTEPVSYFVSDILFCPGNIYFQGSCQKQS